MEDAITRARSRAADLVTDYSKSRGDRPYCRQELKTAMEKAGLPPEIASRFSDSLDDWFDRLERELAHVHA